MTNIEGLPDGTAVETTDTKRVYKVVGGAPTWQATCDVGCGNPVTISDWSLDNLDHLRATPVDGASAVDQRGRVYKFACIPHHRFGKHYRFTRGDIQQILQLAQHNPALRHTAGPRIVA